MAIAFIEHLAGSKIASIIRGQVEVIKHSQDEDPFAEVFNLA